MSDEPAGLSGVSSSALLGYLNFSDGRPDAKWQAEFDRAFAAFADADRPWAALADWLRGECRRLAGEGSAAFRDTSRAEAALTAALDRLPRLYREHHADLLAHQPDDALFNSLFMARACEAALAQDPAPDKDADAVAGAAVDSLNDFVGHRPIAVLETRPQTDYYPHEKVRPVPLYFRGVGAGRGPFRDLVSAGVELLTEVDPDLAREVYFDLAMMDELSFDPRGYDHQHPANRRPNYAFAEWDPHHIDNGGRFRRFVIRQVTLDALLEWTQADGDPGLRLYEAAAALGGVVLMSSGTSGSGPDTFDSTVTLVKLVPRIARFRDRFYNHLIAEAGPHAAALQAEARRLGQPFASVRRHINRTLAVQRAAQLQERELAVLFAEMGYPEASRRRSGRINIASVRMLSEVHVRQSEAEDLTRRGIDCGALPDPWNVIGYQGLYPLFQSREDSVRDPRNEELVTLIGRQFDLYASLLSHQAARQGEGADAAARGRMAEFAAWWDKFAAYEVGDLPRAHGGERAEAAFHVADSLRVWRTRPDGEDEVAFWRRHRDGFRSPSAFAPVIEALTHHNAWKSALSLLLLWLSEADSVPPGEGESSLCELLDRWVDRVMAMPEDERRERVGPVGRLADLLEASADELWAAPDLTEYGPPREADDTFEAAYEGMTFQENIDDSGPGELVGGPEGRPPEFPLEERAESLESHLRFLETVGKFWSRVAPHAGGRAAEWLDAARRQERGLRQFLSDLAELTIPQPLDYYETVVDFERRRALREQLLEAALGACVEAGQGVRALAAAAGGPAEGAAGWQALAVRLEQALADGDIDEVRGVLPDWVPEFRGEPLLFVPVSAGGDPLDVLRARAAQTHLMTLVRRLPGLGLLRETFHVTELAREMEQATTLRGRKVTEFDQLFRAALRSVVHALLAAAEGWDEFKNGPEAGLPTLLRRAADAFQSLWLTHSQSLRLSTLEGERASDVEARREFIKRYGRELFTVQSLALPTIRNALHRGVDSYIDEILKGDDPLKPSRFARDIEGGALPRRRAANLLESVLQALAEHVEEYRDYNATTTQSDYGENLHQLLDYAALKVEYDRFAWRLRPTVLAHDALCRRGHLDYADRWRDTVPAIMGRTADALLKRLGELEAKHGIQLRTVRDRLEERFIMPMQLDRLCALVGPACRGDAAAFAELESQLGPFTDPPTGNGLDTPDWLRRLQEEVHEHRFGTGGEDAVPPPPTRVLTYDELEAQIDDWDRPIT